MTRAAIYCRISSDRVDPVTGHREGLGVQRQLEDCTRLVVSRAWTLVDTFVDNDISAFSGRRRPEWDRLLQLVQAGALDAVVAWHPDRMYRRMIELEDLVDLVEHQKVVIATVMGGDVDLSTSSGRLQARMMGVVARHESEHKSERVARKRLQEAETGQVQGTLGYGWKREDVLADGRATKRYVIDEEQAAIVRELAERLLHKESLNSLARELNARLVPMPSGAVGRWRSGNLRNFIIAARFCGWREHRTEAQRRLGYNFGTFMAEGAWPPILTRRQTEDLRTLLADPTRATSRQATELLVGILRCGRCSSPMTAQHVGRGHRYACVAQPGLTRCGGLTIVGPGVDRFVSGLVLRALSDSEAAVLATTAAGTTATDHERLQADLDQLAADWGGGLLTHSEWQAARRPLMARMQAITALEQAERRSVLRRRTPRHRNALVRRWNELSLNEQRGIVSDLLVSVEVLRVGRGQKPPAEQRIGRICWAA